MVQLRRLSFGIVLTPLAERELLDAPPAVAERVRLELVRRACSPPHELASGPTGEPCTFIVAGHTVILRADPATGTLVAERVTPVRKSAARAQSFRVLLVDDDRFALTLLGDRLRHLGHDVVSVDSGQGALAQDLDAFDAVVCDFVMPEMNGAELLRRVREERRSSVRFIFVTATRHPEELVREAIRHDADFLPKPVELESLVELIAEGRRVAGEGMSATR